MKVDRMKLNAFEVYFLYYSMMQMVSKNAKDLQISPTTDVLICLRLRFHYCQVCIKWFQFTSRAYVHLCRVVLRIKACLQHRASLNS